MSIAKHDGGEQRLGFEDRRGGTLLSIVTITFNNATGLRSTLQSISSQEHIGNVELIIIDGGSADMTSEIVKDFAPSGTIFISEPDRGVYDAMNKGWRLARGSFVQFLNAGDRFVDSTSLRRCLHALRSNPAAGWIIGGAMHLHGGARQPSIIGNLPHNWWRHARGIQPHCHQSCMFSHELLVALGGFSEDFQFAGDFDLILRAGLARRPTEFEDIVIVYEGGGVSAQQARAVPLLLHEVRVQRLGLTGLPRKVDRAMTTARASKTRFAIRGGELRRRFPARKPG